MGRVLTNNVSMSYSIESALGTAGTTWFLVEPNEISTFGAEITTVARDPISRNRQRRKGTVTDLDSSVEFTADLTLSAFRDFIEGFVFATGVNTDVTDIPSTAAETTGDTYTVAALTSDQADKFESDTEGSTLIWAKNFNESGNNGLKVLDTDVAASATAIPVADNLTDEASPPSNAIISFAGFRIAAGQTPSWTYSAPQATLAGVTGLGTILAGIGLTVGQVVHIGSVASAGSTTIQNAFENATANDMYGKARVVTINADSVVFDKLDSALQATDASVATAIDIIFGQFIRNVATTDTAYLERSFQFEMEFPNLDDPNDEYQYAIGNYCNTVSFIFELADKAVVEFGFIGTDTENPVTSGSRKSGASSATDPLHTGAYNTTADIARLRVTETDEDGITTDFKSMTLALNNNVSAEKVLAQLGAAFMNTGNFEVDLEAQILFTDGAVINKIRDNETVTMDFAITNDDGMIAMDIPSMTLGDGSREFPRNETVLANLGGQAFQDATLGTSLSCSIIPIPIP